VYFEDLRALAVESDLRKVVTLSETPKEKEFEETKKLWDRAFNQPYEKAGGEVPFTLEGVTSIESPVYWEESGTDVNTKYKSMLPRFLLEVNFLLSFSASNVVLFLYTCQIVVYRVALFLSSLCDK